MMPMRSCKWTPLVFLVWMPALDADVRLPALVSDHMVLQRDAPVRIYGWADAAEAVSVRLQNHGATAVTGAGGRWEAWLPPMPAGGPFEMTVAGKNTLTVRDVLVGEVWVGSGQSNMVWPVERSDNAGQEAAGADFPRIRLFKVELKVSDQPRHAGRRRRATLFPARLGPHAGRLPGGALEV